MTLKPAAFLKIVADSPATLRKCDLYRLFSECPPRGRYALRHYVIANRTDLASEVIETLREIEEEESQ